METLSASSRRRPAMSDQETPLETIQEEYDRLCLEKKTLELELSKGPSNEKRERLVEKLAKLSDRIIELKPIIRSRQIDRHNVESVNLIQSLNRLAGATELVLAELKLICAEIKGIKALIQKEAETKQS
jgi:hypothetical protein